MRPSWLVALAACGSSGEPCDGIAETCVAVRITSATVAAIDTLELDISYAGFHATAQTRSSPTSLPLAAAVELTAVVAPVTLDVVAAGKRAGAVLGTGYARHDSLLPGAHVVLPIAIAARPQPCTLGTYCGGDRVDGDPGTLYLCHAGGSADPDGTVEADVPTARGYCANGCIVNTGTDDACSGGSVRCTEGNTYCGGDKLDGDPQHLYRCDATGKGVFVQDCAATGKQCAPSGITSSDICR